VGKNNVGWAWGLVMFNTTLPLGPLVARGWVVKGEKKREGGGSAVKKLKKKAGDFLLLGVRKG